MKKVDHLGKIFGNLKVVKAARPTKDGRSQWWVVCLCGRGEKYCVISSSLVRGLSTRCRLCKFEHISTTLKKREPARKATLESAINSMFSQYKYHAKLRSYCFELNLENFTNLIKSNCNYCGGFGGKKLVTGRLKQYKWEVNGIDRINNEIGYTDTNCVSCCSLCNKMKWTLGIDIFLNHVKKIRDFQESKG